MIYGVIPTTLRTDDVKQQSQNRRPQGSDSCVTNKRNAASRKRKSTFPGRLRCRIISCATEYFFPNTLFLMRVAAQFDGILPSLCCAAASVFQRPPTVQPSLESQSRPGGSAAPADTCTLLCVQRRHKDATRSNERQRRLTAEVCQKSRRLLGLGRNPTRD